MRFYSLIHLRPFETETEEGRSKERLRKAVMTTLAASAAKASALLTSLISIPLTYRYLGSERYGVWMVLTSIIAAMGFADLGIGNGLMNAISEAYGKDDRQLAREYITSSFVLLLGIAAALTVLGAAAYPFLSWTRLLNVNSTATASEGATAFLVLYASFLINIPLGVITRAQAGLQEGYTSQIVTAFGGILSLGSILLAIALRGDLAWLVFASVFANVIATLLNGLLLFRAHSWLLPSFSFYRGNSARKIFRLGIMFFILQCAAVLGYTSDNIVIAQILGETAVSSYSIPQKLFSFVATLVGMAIFPLWPAYCEAITRGDARWVKRTFIASLWFALAITVPLCALLSLGGPWVLDVALGKSFHAPMSLLIVLAVWGVVNAVSMVTSIFLNGAGVLREQTVLVIVSSLVNLALSIYLTRRMGVIGCCLGSIIAQSFITLPVCALLIRNRFRKLDGITVGTDCLAETVL